ncbi:MAG: 50S ribosomal protein L17 [Candidatus Marinimicrobia bacterium]|nr:50S ribosomal protein L17 [Candidatus Neomarinimicrobiota bacterium]|tara:strand:- start:3060 stop:3482 length:423 start_codon:yes stop_codon:yes gene_type:complete
MRHQKRVKKLGRSASHRRATLANLASSLIEHNRIKTTHAKAKATQQFVEPLITKARRGTLHDRRTVLKLISRPDIVKILFDEIAPRFVDRPGGYTRVTKLGFRDNDCASVSMLEFVDSAAVVPSLEEEKKAKSKAESSDD